MKLYPIFIRPGGGTIRGRVSTQCFLITEDKKAVAFGQAFKRPEDNFDRKKGMRIALGRAVKAYQIGYFRHTRWDTLYKAARLPDFYTYNPSAGGYSTMPASRIPVDIIEKIHLENKEPIEIVSDEVFQQAAKFEGFTSH